MKKYYTLIVLLVGSLFTRAQSFEIGARYLATSNWFFNSNVTNSGGSQNVTSENYDAAYSYSYGLHLAYNFTDHTGIETDLMFASLSQSYDGAFSEIPGVLTTGFAYYPGGDYKSTTTLSVMQIPVMFRFLSGNGAYVELGPQIELLNNAEYNATYKQGPVSSSSENVKSDYASSYFSGVLGFGNNIRLAPSFFFNIHLRLIYDFTDLKGVDALGQNLKDNRLYESGSPYQMYGSYAPTNAISAAFGIGLIYRIGHDF